jgi:hypothetical protein
VSKDKRYSIIGGRKRALSRWYMIRYRTSHTEFKKNKAYKGIEFNLDKETFIKWFQERDFENASVDRIDKNKGYTMDNIQLISLAENIRKDKVKSKNGYCICFSCKQNKPIEDFAKDNRRYNGHSTICKACDKERSSKHSGLKWNIINGKRHYYKMELNHD